jgi:hypothetical protein
LVEVASQLKTELISFLKSVMNDKGEWGGETSTSAREYRDILQDFYFTLYLKVFSVLP